MEIPDAIVYAAAAYIAASGAVFAALALLASPALVIARPPSKYFDDWNAALKAPWLFWRIGGWLFRLQELLGNYVLPAPQRACDLAFAFFRSQVLITVAELGVPDLLRAHGPMTGAALAAATGADAGHLERVLRAAARMGLVSVARPPAPPPQKGGSTRGRGGLLSRLWGRGRGVAGAACTVSSQPLSHTIQAAATAAAAAAAPSDSPARSTRAATAAAQRRAAGGAAKASAAPAAAAAAATAAADSDEILPPPQHQQQQPPAEWPPGRFDLDGRAVYGLTSLSAVLCDGHPNSVRAMVRLFGDHYGPAGRLLDGVRTGATPYELWSGGVPHWEHMAREPKLRARFNAAMAQFNALSPVEAVFDACPAIGRAARVVDVGGGLGALLAAALRRYPHLKGALFDLPRVVEAARAAWAADAGPGGRAELLPRAEFHGGSFFDAGSVPRAARSDGDDDGGHYSDKCGGGGGDVYVLREVLHDWGDADATAILREVRRAAGGSSSPQNSGGAAPPPPPPPRLVIVEAAIASSMACTASARIGGDVHMLAQYGGAKERTEAQFAALLGAAGFKMERVAPTKGLFFVIEAAPV